MQKQHILPKKQQQKQMIVRKNQQWKKLKLIVAIYESRTRRSFKDSNLSITAYEFKWLTISFSI